MSEILSVTSVLTGFSMNDSLLTINENSCWRKSPEKVILASSKQTRLYRVAFTPNSKVNGHIVSDQHLLSTSIYVQCGMEQK